MHRIIKLQVLARVVSIVTALISVGLYAIFAWWQSEYPPLLRIITFATTVSSILLLLLSLSISSRVLLWLYGWFDKNAFHDLSGSWEGSIVFKAGGVEHEMKVRAIVRQTIDCTQIDLHGPSMKSSTLEATPLVDSGQRKLYYVYHCIPKNPEYSPYYGSTIFDIRRVGGEDGRRLGLSGRYFTDRQTIGRIELVQNSHDPSVDVSYY